MKQYNEKFFETKVNKNSNKEMFDFLRGHFTYWTMNSWNGLSSIANNVKVYNIGLPYEVLEMLEIDEYMTLKFDIEDWEEEHKGYSAGFNGQSGGYLVLYNDNNNTNVLDIYITNSDDYEDFKAMLKEDNYTLKDYHDKLVEQVELVQDFDRLCDTLRNECLYMLDNCKIKERDVTYTKTEKYLDWECE